MITPKLVNNTFIAVLFLQINLFAQWNKIDGPFQNLTIKHIFISGNNLYVGAEYDLFVSPDGGKNWKNIITNSQFILSLLVDGPNIFVGTVRGIKISNDNGMNWNSLQNELSSYRVMDIIKIDSLLYAGTDKGVFISKNNGISWTASNSGLVYPNAYKFSKCNSNLFLVAYWTNHPNVGFGVFSSSNYGANWINKSNGMDFRAIMDIASEGQNLFISTSGTTSNSILKTTNYGESWLQIGLAPNSADCLVANGTSLFAGTRNGIYLTTNDGTSWNSVNDGLYNISVNTTIINGPYIYLGAYGSVWKRLLSEMITDINNNNDIPNNYSLKQNYPNPFNPATTITYTIPEDGKVQIKVFDILGREVTTLVNEFTSTGKHNVVWDGANFASGIYFYSIRFKGQMLNRKMLLIK